jgi:hypothetical protein
MTSDRDEMAKAVFLADNYNATDDVTLSDWEALVASDGDGSYAHRIAQGLMQAGYRTPQQVLTAKELDALPEGSVIRTAGHEEFPPRVAVKTIRFESGVSYWQIADADDFESTSDELDDLPATVLHIGGGK